MASICITAWCKLTERPQLSGNGLDAHAEALGDGVGCTVNDVVSRGYPPLAQLFGNPPSPLPTGVNAPEAPGNCAIAFVVVECNVWGYSFTYRPAPPSIARQKIPWLVTLTQWHLPKLRRSRGLETGYSSYGNGAHHAGGLAKSLAGDTGGEHLAGVELSGDRS